MKCCTSLAMVAGSLTTCATFAAPCASAAVVYEFGDASLVRPVGTAISVPIYLRFGGTDLATLTAGDGLLSAGVRLDRSGTVPSDPSKPTAIAANTSAFNDPVFTPSYLPKTDTSAGFWAFADLTGPSGVAGEGVGSDRLVLIGSVTFQLGVVPGETTTFVASDYDPTTEQIVTFGLPPAVFDPIVQSASLTLSTAVPEPAVAGVLLGSLVLLRPARCRA